jgi:hypothetical protein
LNYIYKVLFVQGEIAAALVISLNNGIYKAKISFAVMLFTMLSFAPAAYAISFFDQFIDPQDNKFDASHWLLGKKASCPFPSSSQNRL